MAQNEFTKKNFLLGIHGQKILDVGLNVFGLQLFLESYTNFAGKDAEPVEFTYLGVDVKLKINEAAKFWDTLFITVCIPKYQIQIALGKMFEY